MTNDKIAREILPGAIYALEDAIFYFDRFCQANTPIESASQLNSLYNAMSDLRSFHPGFDINSGTMPWDRDEDE